MSRAHASSIQVMGRGSGEDCGHDPHIFPCMSPVTSDWLGVLHLSQLYCMNEAGRLALDIGLVQQSGEYGTYNQAAGAVLGAVQR